MQNIINKVKAGIQFLQDAVTRYQNERNRRIILDRQLAGLTDPTFLDRALAGEEKKQ